MNDYVAIWYDWNRQSVSWISADQPHPIYAILVIKKYAPALCAFLDVDVEAQQTFADITSLIAAMDNPKIRSRIVLPAKYEQEAQDE